MSILRVPSGGGSLGVSSSTLPFHAEILNLNNAYDTGYGSAGYSLYGGADSVYHGSFYQSIDVYINAAWLVPAVPSVPAFWIDMTPYHADPNNYGAEHNFRLTATGGSLEVRVDSGVTPIATITTSGWYTFTMSWSKAATPSDPVLTDMKVTTSSGTLMGSVAGLPATSPGGPFASSDLRGNGYVWLTLWQNNFANNLVAIDNVRTGLYPAPFTVKTNDQTILTSLLPAAGENDTRRLNDALKHLTKSLNAEYWTSEGRLSSKGGAVFQQEKDSVIKLLELVKSGFNVTVIQGVIADLVSADQSLAQIAIDQATDAKKIAKAQDELSKGAADSAAGRPINAIEHYRNAWNHATQ